MSLTPQIAARKMMAAVTALAIGLGTIAASSTPARADNEAAKVIAGVAALALIGTAINKSKREEEQRAQHHAPPRGWHNPQPPRHHAARPGPGRHAQNCVQTRDRKVVCGQPTQIRPHQQPPRHGWNNSQRRDHHNHRR